MEESLWLGLGKTLFVTLLILAVTFGPMLTVIAWQDRRRDRRERDED